MNKGRLETFSDSIFAIAMTLLVIDIKVPELARPVTEAALMTSLQGIIPLLIVYAVSFIVLATLWLNHHAVFHYFAKEVDRALNNINMIYLMFVAFVPFSAHLIGTYHTVPAAVVIYGLNILAIVSLSFLMVTYILGNDHLAHDKLTDRLIRQARFRSGLKLRVRYARHPHGVRVDPGEHLSVRVPGHLQLHSRDGGYAGEVGSGGFWVRDNEGFGHE